MKDPITVLLYMAIAVLESYIIYCEVRLWKIIDSYFDARTDARREHYRKIAYKLLDERTIVKLNRQELWRSIRK